MLTEALSWPDSGNTITDGEQLYDLLVDWGWRGQERFGALCFDLAAASGLITETQALQLKDTLRSAMEQAFTGLGEEQSREAQEAADPTSPA